MKTFGELKIGDKIYQINNDSLDIKSYLVQGIEDIILAHTEIKIHLVNGKSMTLPFGSCGEIRVLDNWFASFEAATIERRKMKEEIIEKNFNIAMSKFRKIKKLMPDTSKQKERVLQFFQMLEKE